MKQCLVRDSDSHWYCIPYELKSKFYDLNEDEDSWEAFESAFSDYRLGYHISCYVFENFQEIE